MKIAVLVSILLMTGVCMASIVDTGVLCEDYSDKALDFRAQIYERGYTEIPNTIKISVPANRIVVR